MAPDAQHPTITTDPFFMTHLIHRRSLLAMGAAMATFGPDASIAAEAAASDPDPDPDPEMAQHTRQMMAISAGAPKVAMLVYPNMVALDLIGPMTVLNILRCDIQLVWKHRGSVATDIGMPISATKNFDETPHDLDVLFVPGGIVGTVDCMNDPEVCAFLADRGARAKWVTGVCTGTLILAAAGLLKGFDATSHWAVADLLPLMGARHVDQRVVVDRNRMTGGGVTAGIDFGLRLAAVLKNEEAARRVQLIIEYAPDPPFQSGTPSQAGPERVAAVRKARTLHDLGARAAALAAGKRLSLQN